jgi:hypothetical protein
MSRVSVEELAALGEAWAEKHRQLERSSSSKNSPHVKALSQMFRHRDTSIDEKEVIEDRVEVPSAALPPPPLLSRHTRTHAPSPPTNHSQVACHLMMTSV